MSKISMRPLLVEIGPEACSKVISSPKMNERLYRCPHLEAAIWFLRGTSSVSGFMAKHNVAGSLEILVHF